MTPDKDDTTISTTVADSGGAGSTLSSDVVQIKNCVINRLIEISSPLSEVKRECFKRLVHNEAESMTIINMAAVNGSSVEGTKDMIITFCNK